MRKWMPCVLIISAFLLAGCGGRSANLIRISEAQLARLDTAQKATQELAEKASSTQKRLFEALVELQKNQREGTVSAAKAQMMKKHFPNPSAITVAQLSLFLDEWRAVIEREETKLRTLTALEQASRATLEERAAEMKRLFFI